MKMAGKTTEKSTALVVSTTAPLVLSNELPDYLKGGEASGIENFAKEDFKIPEIKLLQGLSPELVSYKETAVLGEYFHTGIMKSLGASFRSVLCVARKRIIVFRPKNDQGGGILAISNDGKTWKMGANQEFSVMLKGAKKPVVWKTKSNVEESGLTDFGTSNPDSEGSAPAAQVYYEYIHYLPDFKDASPVVQRIKSTGLDNARKLNSYFLLQKKPIYVHALEWTVEAKSNSDGNWTIPKVRPIGYVDETTFLTVKGMNEQYANIELEIQQEGENEIAEGGSEKF